MLPLCVATQNYKTLKIFKKSGTPREYVVDLGIIIGMAYSTATFAIRSTVDL